MSEPITTGDSEPESTESAESNIVELVPGTRRGVLCVKCESLNDPGVDLCRRCQSHLHVFCHRCGAKNARVNSRCEQCRRSLHRGVGSRVKGKDGDINLLLIGVGFVAILLVLAVVIWASNFRNH